MRHVPGSTLLVSMVLLAGCRSDRITSGGPAAGQALLDRGSLASGTLAFSTIDPPGATWAQASGIAPGGVIVGSYNDAAGVGHGFVLQGDQYTAIDVPDDVAGGHVSSTSANGIGPDGEIVGNYTIAGEPPINAHGFLRTVGGDFVRVHDVDHINEVPQRLLPDGTILGCIHDAVGSTMRGLVLGRRDTTVIAANVSMVNGATPDRHHLAGLWFDTDPAVGHRVGFTIDDGVFQSFQVPGSNVTAAWDMNPAGVIVGNYRTGSGTAASPFMFHGFIRTRSKDAPGIWAIAYRSVDVPGALNTLTLGINPGGTIVGGYTMNGTMHAYVATIVPSGQQ